MKHLAAVLIALSPILSLPLLHAQDKPKVEPPKLADVLRENETLKRENTVLKASLRDRDARLQLASFEREGMVRAVISDPNDPDGSKAVKARCELLEGQLRAVDKPDDKSTFDCQTLTFRKPE